ncbi:metallophosphoesterase family protein [Acetobacterium woodii]|uniref:Phosphoesterase n=1 Tax=Acetobacterium woodii (strain ATCC 29683 / DSM 1030 / JCM 2381 / KCTC 1655 / WB1) TaxID=931626 RepID=H6LGX4_ACEWD|nr:metallophosphoesterase [Acetobacterium woodii]AFA47112.1 phosphoesterase [Acetobacterium woodii DSM 1030]
MKIGIMSDSHGNLKAVKQAVDEMGPVDVIIHLGDYVEDALYLRTITNTPVHILKGNLDSYANEGSMVLETTLGGFTFFASHGHKYGVKNNLDRLYYAGMEKNAQVVLYGHTHQAYINDDGRMLVMNPGSVGAPRMGDPESYGLITIEKGNLDAKIIPLWG